jgi:diaminopimelate epimerase
MKIEFNKFQGTGNDFVLLDNREGRYSQLTAKQVNLLCNRRFGIGADGLILLNNKEGYDFEMKYYNADGKIGSLCGNGARCVLKFASLLGIKKDNYRFHAADGVHEGEIDLNGDIRLKMQDVKNITYSLNHYLLDTGSPHYIKTTADVMNVDVVNEGRAIRNNKEFAANGINVNFVETLDDDLIYVRTYERGVEDETLSCGTGVTAAALISAHNDNGFNRVKVKTAGGKLSVEFDKISENEFTNIWLCGPAELVYTGVMQLTD